MAGHLDLPAKRAREREDKCKTERQQLDLFRNGHVRVAPLFAGGIYGFTATRQKSNDWFRDAKRLDCNARPQGRRRKDEERRLPERRPI